MTIIAGIPHRLTNWGALCVDGLIPGETCEWSSGSPIGDGLNKGTTALAQRDTKRLVCLWREAKKPSSAIVVLLTQATVIQADELIHVAFQS